MKYNFYGGVGKIRCCGSSGKVPFKASKESGVFRKVHLGRKQIQNLLTKAGEIKAA